MWPKFTKRQITNWHYHEYCSHCQRAYGAEGHSMTDRTHEKHGCVSRKHNGVNLAKCFVVSIRWTHTCMRKSFPTIWCNCRNSKYLISTNTHTMNQSAKKLISHCTQVYLENIREKHYVVNSSREPSNIFCRFSCFNRDFSFIDGFLLSFYAVWEMCVFWRFRGT